MPSKGLTEIPSFSPCIAVPVGVCVTSVVVSACEVTMRTGVYYRKYSTVHMYITKICPFLCCACFCRGYITQWGRVTHICVGNLTIIGSDNGLSPGRRQAITWTNVGILLIGPIGTNFSEMLIAIHTFSFKKMHLKMSSAKLRPFFLGLNVLMCPYLSGSRHWHWSNRMIAQVPLK